MNWENILKVQITTSRQKLRTDKEPLPDDDDDECFPIVEKIYKEILQHFEKFTQNTYAEKLSGHPNFTLEAFTRNLYEEDEWCSILAGFSKYEHNTLNIIDRKPISLYTMSRFNTDTFYEDGFNIKVKVHLDRLDNLDNKLLVDFIVTTVFDTDTQYHVSLRYVLPDLTIGVMEELEFLHEAIKNTIESNAKVSFPTSPEFMNMVREYTRGI